VTPQLPTLEAPPTITAAVKRCAERAEDFAKAQAALREARIAVETAVADDRAAYARARDARKGDPGPTRERAAREHVADCQRREAGEAMRLARAEDALAAAVDEHVDDWADRVAKRWAALDVQAERKLDELEQVEAERTQLRQLAAWLAGLQQGGDATRPTPTVADATQLADARSADAFLSASGLRAALREHIASTSARGFAAQAPERAEARRAEMQLGELRADPNPQVQVAAHHVWLGEITLTDALAIRDGRLGLAEALDLGRRRRAEQRGVTVAG
jgi:hypothetical protein